MESQPQAWLEYAGLAVGSPVRVTVMETDLATVTAEADRVLRVDQAAPYLAHLEFQASYDPTLGKRLLRYNVLLHYRHDLPVQSVALLLRREADGPSMTGGFRYGVAAEPPVVDFRYQVVRVWEKPVEAALSSGLAILPLAPLAAVSPEALPEVIRRMERRIAQEAATDAEASLLWTSTYILMGLRYPPALAEQLLQGVRQMKESSTYQAILAEGRAEGRAAAARAILLRQGRKRFGIPSASVETTLAGVDTVERLEQLAERLLEVESWDELLRDDS